MNIISLTRNDGVEVNFVWEYDVGVWSNRNPESLRIANDIVKDVQRKTHHCRDTMCLPYKWTNSIENAVKRENLEYHNYDGSEGYVHYPG